MRDRVLPVLDRRHFPHRNLRRLHAAHVDHRVARHLVHAASEPHLDKETHILEVARRDKRVAAVVAAPRDEVDTRVHEAGEVGDAAHDVGDAFTSAGHERFALGLEFLDRAAIDFFHLR